MVIPNGKIIGGLKILPKPEWFTILGKSTWDGTHVLKYATDTTNPGRQSYDFGPYVFVEHRELRRVGYKKKFVVVSKRQPREGDVFVMFNQLARKFKIFEPDYWEWYKRKLAQRETLINNINEEYRRVTGHD